MTPKEKAKQLKERFENALTVKDCQMIGVDEILKANPIIPLQFMLESESLDAANEYWQEVKQELENFKNK